MQDSSPQQPWWGPGRARMLAALLALLGLLALVALASRGHRPFAGGAGGGTGQEPSTLFWDYLFSVALALGVIGAGVVVWALLGARGASPKHKPGQTRVYGLLVFCLLMLAITVAVRSLQRHDAASSGDGRPLLQAPEVRPDQRRQQRSRPPELQWVPVAIVGTTVGLALAYLVARRRYRLRMQNELTDERLTEEFTALVDDTLDDLRAEPDPRRAVIAAYARMERVLGAYGLPRRPFEAPLEYLDRIAGELHGRLPSARRLVFELTHLFEQAKFSPHAIDADMKEEAIASLTRLRDDLRAESEQAA